MPRKDRGTTDAIMQPVKPDAKRQRPVTRGYPEGTEILTEHGFYLFEDLATDELLGAEVAHTGKGMPQTWKADDLPYTLYTPGSNFPRVASVDPSTGEVVYTRPSLFRTYTYDGRLAQLKMKGVDILMARYTDLWLKGRYGREWKFTLADNVRRVAQAANSHYFLLDKFNQDLYGEYEPREGLFARLDAPITVRPEKHSSWRRIDDLFPYTALDAAGHRVKLDRVRTEVNIYNVDVEPFHTIIIRRGRKDNNPRTPWIGNPVVVGDGSDKSLMRVNRIRALREKN